MNEELTKNNESIAVFLGGEVREAWRVSDFPSRMIWEGEMAKRYRQDLMGLRTGDVILTEELEFHSSWDWLMPVWKKAGSWLYEKRAAFTQLDYTTAHRITKQFIDACQKSDIDAAYLAIIGAVTFINELTRDDYDRGAEG